MSFLNFDFVDNFHFVEDQKVIKFFITFFRKSFFFNSALSPNEALELHSKVIKRNLNSELIQDQNMEFDSVLSKMKGKYYQKINIKPFDTKKLFKIIFYFKI